MGLDQYLMRKVNNDESVEEIYWRKANFVHRFFFDKHFDEDDYEFGEDNCVPMETSKEDLIELLDECKALKLCRDTLGDKANETAEYLLPTMSGFFFGSTDYDEWYWEDVEYTIKEVEALLERATDDDEFYYYAWY